MFPGITADKALRLAPWFGTSAEFWLNLQKLCDLRQVQTRSAAGSKSCLASPERYRWEMTALSDNCATLKRQVRTR
jgi:plasmid maintenance system antidote protein VapI